jgi:phage I-like protein
MKDRFKLPEDGWFHLVPKGRFPIADPQAQGRKIVQVVDDEAVRSMLDRFKADSKQQNFAGLLVDFDHFSYDADKSSKAAGWVTELESRADGIWGRIRWTDEGEALLRGGAFRFVSPVWDKVESQKLGATEVRPLRLESLGVTNAPNMRGMVPLANSLRSQKPAYSGETFVVLLNRASGRAGDAARGLQVLQIEEAAAYESTSPLDRINVLVNRIREETGSTMEQAWDWANKIAPDEFAAADPQYLTNRSRSQLDADRRAYRVAVLMKRDGLTFSEAFSRVR